MERGPMRVLVVEDYLPLRKSIMQGLREAAFVVDACGDGEEGLWYATSNDYDAVVLDLMLPRLDGLSVLRRLRQAGSAVHVLILTAKDGLDDRVQGINSGADDYLVKPFAFEELLARVRALVRRKYGSKSPVIRVGDLEIDTTARRVRRAGRSVELTAREYSLLELLALRAGQLVTRPQIWEHLYDFASETSSNVVDVYVGYLRRKLEGEGLPRLIQTRRGEGYLLEAPS
ncbi:MAG: response regulator transcription factor [Planctomycetes bacterium]|nr:response regulator transcription factor [Planctomycetota bacterium]